MDIHEYQAKEILANFGVGVPPGALAVPTCRAGSHPPHPDGDVRGGPGTV